MMRGGGGGGGGVEGRGGRGWRVGGEDGGGKVRVLRRAGCVGGSEGIKSGTYFLGVTVKLGVLWVGVEG